MSVDALHFDDLLSETGDTPDDAWGSEPGDTAQNDLWRREPFDREKYLGFYELVAGSVGVGLLFLLGPFIFKPELVPAYWANIYVTLVGVVLTIAVIDRRNERRAIQARKRALMLQLGSRSNDFALEAKRLLELEGWLEEALRGSNFDYANWRDIRLPHSDLRSKSLRGATLQGADLRGANLQGAYLPGATLQEADLRGADLQGADLRGATLRETHLSGATLQEANLSSATLQGAHLSSANLQRAKLLYATLQGVDLSGADLQGARLFFADLQGADLKGADLQGTRLRGANLQGANLRGANLEGANLWEVNLEGANLSEANLQGVVFVDARFDETTRLPDGSLYAEGTDLARFTDPAHPDFWRSNHPLSPAYRRMRREN